LTNRAQQEIVLSASKDDLSLFLLAMG